MKHLMFLMLSFYFFFISCPVYSQSSLTFSVGQNSELDNFIFNEILKEAYQKIGINIHGLHLPSARSLVYANVGKTDGETSRMMSISETYPNLLVVPVVLLHAKVSAFTSQDNVRLIKGWQSLRSSTVAIQRGMKLVEINAEKNDWQISKVSTTSQLFKMLLGGRVKFAVTDSINGLYSLSYIKKSGTDISNIVALEPPLSSKKLYHFLHKKNKHLIPKITASLQKMEKDGTIQRRFDSFMAQITK